MKKTIIILALVLGSFSLVAGEAKFEMSNGNANCDPDTADSVSLSLAGMGQTLVEIIGHAHRCTIKFPQETSAAAQIFYQNIKTNLKNDKAIFKCKLTQMPTGGYSKCSGIIIMSTSGSSGGTFSIIEE